MFNLIQMRIHVRISCEFLELVFFLIFLTCGLDIRENVRISSEFYELVFFTFVLKSDLDENTRQNLM